jgi:hypothetical protein
MLLVTNKSIFQNIKRLSKFLYLILKLLVLLNIEQGLTIIRSLHNFIGAHEIASLSF